jgi:hypothetical protein
VQLDYVAWEKVITDHGHIHALPLGIRFARRRCGRQWR